jgi:hypothetical protein
MIYQDKFASISLHPKGYIVTKFTGYDPSSREFEKYLEAYKNVLMEQESYYQIFDATDSKNLKSELRVRQSKWIEENRELLKQKTKKVYFVIPSLFVRIVLNGIFVMSKPPYPYEIMSTMEEAEKALTVN